MRTQLPSSSRQPMPCTSMAIGVPAGPLAGPVSFAVMSMLKPALVSSRSPCSITTSWRKPKSSGATKLVSTRPALSLLSVAILYATGVNSRPKYSATVTFQCPLTVRQTRSSCCSGGNPSPLTLIGVPTGPCVGETASRPTKPSLAWVNCTCGPSSAARGAAHASPTKTPHDTPSAQMSALSRARPTIIGSALVGLLKFDCAVEDAELRGRYFERLPGLRVALLVRHDKLVLEG